MLYPNLKIEPHAKDRILERMGFVLDTPNSELGIIKRINEESIHVCDDKGNKEIRFFRISHHFYLAVISKRFQMVITVMHPNHGNYNLAVKRFERSVSKDTNFKTLSRYIEWRKDWIYNKGWSWEIPNDDRLRLIKIWGDTHHEARWVKDRWIGEEGEFEASEVWGWKEIEVKKIHKIKPTKKMRLCQDCAFEHAGIDKHHFLYAILNTCEFCEQETLCLDVHKDKTDLFPERLEAVS